MIFRQEYRCDLLMLRSSYISAVVMLLMQGVSDEVGRSSAWPMGRARRDTTKAVRDLAYRFAFGVAVVCSVVLFLLRGSAAPSVGASEQVTMLVAQILPDLHYRLCLCQRVQSDHRLFLCDWGKISGPIF